jgi:phosphoadenosine phosphosulfate reductase
MGNQTKSDTGHYALFSGGHDSLVATDKAMTAGHTDTVLHIDTGIGIPETREYVEQVCDEQGWPLEVVSSDFDYAEVVKEYQFPGPAVHIIMYSKLKERALRKVARWHDDKPHFYTGVRKDESERRFRNLNDRVQEAQQWVWHAPILHHKQNDVDDWIDTHGLPRSPVKQQYHHSGECLCGAFGNRTEELTVLEAHYPDTADRIKAIEREVQAAHGDDDPRSFWGHGGMSNADLRALLAEHDDDQMMLCVDCGDWGDTYPTDE